MFCSNCGQKLIDTAKFCDNCGTKVVTNEVPPSKQKTIYEGQVHKCPNCGDIIDAYETICEACGFEIRGSNATLSVKEFVAQLTAAQNDNQKILIIRNFPIPNTKEDIFEFMILAATNIKGVQPKTVYDAWIVKFEQCYHKAQLVMLDTKDLDYIKNLYDSTHKLITKHHFQKNTETVGNALSKSRKLAKSFFALISKSLAVIAGILLLVTAINIDQNGGNASMHELIGVVLLIASAATQLRRDTSFLEIIIGAGSGVLSFRMAQHLENGSLLQLGGAVTLIIIAICFFKRLLKSVTDKK